MQKSSTPALSIRGLTKTFPGVIANDNINLDFFPGKIHTILGENGAGKSTLMRIVAGLYQQDCGEILLKGEPVDIRSAKDAFSMGIGMVHQHFMLVKRLSVVENVVLGQEGSPFVLDLTEAAKRINQIASDYHLALPLDHLVGDLSVGEQQYVEIIRLLYRNSNILIFDEPTAVLTPQEASRLGEMLKKLANEGQTIIYITHKLKEALTISDMITVMRAGKIIETLPASEAEESTLVTMMIGKRPIRKEIEQIEKDNRIVLETNEICSTALSQATSLKKISIRVHAGEVVGLAGISGNGQRQLAEVLAGLRKTESGEIRLIGKLVTGLTPRTINKEGIAFVPGNRLEMGLVGSLPVKDNLILKGYHRSEFRKGLLINQKKVEKYSDQVIRDFSIMVPNAKMPLHLLSGGNQQKVILARELKEPHNLLIVEHPTQGLDVRASAEIHNLLREEKAKGKAVLMITSDLDELLEMSDRIYVMHEGEIVGELAADKADPQMIGLLMTGEKEHANLYDDL